MVWNIKFAAKCGLERAWYGTLSLLQNMASNIRLNVQFASRCG